MTNTHVIYGDVVRSTSVRNRSESGDPTLAVNKVTFYKKGTVVEGTIRSNVGTVTVADAVVEFDGIAVPAELILGSAIGEIRQFMIRTTTADAAATTVRVKYGDGFAEADLS